jgi:acyl carrier protein
LKNHGKGPAKDDDTPMRAVGFRSLDFSEVALHVEDQIGRELNFSAAAMRRITTMKDVIDFLRDASISDAEVA